ncbi:MAG: LytTR family DNA-binding domain-containing protein [Acidobacteriota bacterium]|nr:LytTR family DNA-binding domain-containing protein [Acidobacteriota bacterium]
MKVLIVDHEPSARLRLQTLLEENTLVQHIDLAVNAIEAIESINAATPDLVFVEVGLPVLGGLQIPGHIRRQPLFVYCSADAGNALPALEAHAFDFLTKPIGRKRLDLCMEKLRSLQVHFRRMTDRPTDARLRKLICKENRTRHVVWLDDVVMFRKEGRYTGVMTREGDVYLSDRSLDELEAQLGRSDYFRINRAMILAKHSVRRYGARASGSGKVVLTTGETCPISRNRLPAFRTWIEQSV